MISKTILTGIKPTGEAHFGNYLGAIKPALEISNYKYSQDRSIYFIANYHAVTTIHDCEKLKYYTRSVAASWLALGLNPEKTLIFKQSDVPEIFELNWILACLAPKGLMNRAHAYKAKIMENVKNGRDSDSNVNMGLFTYPLLMSADILLFGTDVVPVGKDQIQHVELARDLAEFFNRTYKEIFKLPTYKVKEEVASIEGKDGRKMSKSYDNTISIFEDSKKIKKYIFGIRTDSSSPTDPKNTKKSELFTLYKQFASEEEIEEMRLRYKNGIGWGEVKKILFEKIENQLHEPRQRYEFLMNNPEELDEILKRGAREARAIAVPMLEKVREVVGIE